MISKMIWILYLFLVKTISRRWIREAGFSDSLNYSGLMPYMIEAAKEQQKEIEKLKTEAKRSEDQFETLEKQLEQLLKK